MTQHIKKALSKKKSIFLVYEFLSEPGGLERLMINHANFLNDEGHEVKILTCHLDTKILKELPLENLQIETLPVVHTKFEIINLALCALGLHKMKKHNPDVFFVYSFPANFLVRNKQVKKVNYLNHFLHAYHLSLKERIEWASGTQGMKRWVSVIGSIFLGDWLRRLDKKLVKNNDLKFANSNFTKKRLDNLYSINTEVSYPPLDPKFKPSQQLIKDKFIFSCGRIIPDKKYEWLIESISYSKSGLPLYLAGSVEESYKSKLIALAKKNEVRVKFLGRLSTNELIRYYTSAKVFAFPTPGEDFGLVPAESLACGTPVVVWGDGSGPTEQVIDGVNGFHARPYDKKDFANKIDMVIKSDLKIKNHKLILDSVRKFSYSEIKKDFLKKINKILSSGS